MVTVERLAIQILIRGVSNRNRGAGQYFLDALAQALLFTFRSLQHRLDGIHHGLDALAIGVLVPLQRTDLEPILSVVVFRKQIAQACSHE